MHTSALTSVLYRMEGIPAAVVPERAIPHFSTRDYINGFSPVILGTYDYVAPIIGKYAKKLGKQVWDTASDAVVNVGINYIGNKAASYFYPRNRISSYSWRSYCPRSYRYRPSRFLNRRRRWKYTKKRNQKYREKYKYYKYWYYNQ